MVELLEDAFVRFILFEHDTQTDVRSVLDIIELPDAGNEVINTRLFNKHMKACVARCDNPDLQCWISLEVIIKPLRDRLFAKAAKLEEQMLQLWVDFSA